MEDGGSFYLFPYRSGKYTSQNGAPLFSSWNFDQIGSGEAGSLTFTVNETRVSSPGAVGCSAISAATDSTLGLFSRFTIAYAAGFQALVPVFVRYQLTS